jgi:GT2 family glycosyltransferase
MALTHDLVLCTRNRPDDLAACVASLEAQSDLPGRIHVVDASDADQAERVGAIIAQHPGLPLVHVPAAPGLPAQRNIGVRASTADVIHFLDDDTVLEPGYFAAILRPFAEDQRALSDPRAILGVGGLPTNLPAGRPSPIRRLVTPGTTEPGTVLASGRGVLARGFDVTTDVDWLSGCAMSFRRTALVAEPFDEGLPGYALGEDLELSYRIRQHGRLVVEPAARLEHRESPRNRWARRRWAEADVVNRRRRVASGTGRYQVRAFWVDGLAQLALWSLRACRPGAADARAMAAGIAAGLWACRRPVGAAPAPGPWPPSGAAVGEAPTG